MSKYRPAALDDTQIEKVTELEQKLGKIVVAYEPQSTLAALTQDEVKVIQEAEQRLGKVLVAFDK